MKSESENLIDLLAKITIESMNDHPNWKEDYESENRHKRSEDVKTPSPLPERVA